MGNSPSGPDWLDLPQVESSNIGVAAVVMHKIGLAIQIMFGRPMNLETIPRSSRVLIYSHDSFGLGHLRRCRTIAHSLVAQRSDLSVLILSGSPIIGSFDFRARVDFVRVPGVIKLRNGEYSALSLHLDISQVLELRASIMQHTAITFAPDVFIVDKEPLGLRGEILDTLKILKAMGTRLVLGLRDVMDDPDLLRREWQRKNPVPTLEELYDNILIYGLPQVCEPLVGLDIPESVLHKIAYTGYLRGPSTKLSPQITSVRAVGEPYILVTTGGGGDGEALINWVLSAYEQDASIPYKCLLVFGPFMQPLRREQFRTRVMRLPQVDAITFDAHPEQLIDNALGLVAMGGYNTFCDILSFDKPAIIVPRTKPRLEQYIRTSRAESLGLVRMLDGRKGRHPHLMAAALKNLPDQNPPSATVVPGLLEGLDNIGKLLNQWLSADNQSTQLSENSV